MRMLRAAAAALALAGCAAPPPAPTPVVAARPAAARAVPAAPVGAYALENADFERPARPGERCAEGWSCTMHADPKSYRFFHDTTQPAQGARAYCLEQATKEPFALLTQGFFDRGLAGRRARFSIAVRTEGASGKGAGPWAIVQGRGGRRSLHRQQLVAGTRGWERIALEFTIPANAETVEVGGTLLGPGKACFDDARLEVLAP